MPTGYTAGILDGEIKDFKTFATLCMRAFGATIHMRDEEIGIEYQERTPSDYHSKKIKEANAFYNDAVTFTDAEIIAKRVSELNKEKDYHLESIEKAKENRKRLIAILKDAYQYEPPTSEHTGIKDFMIQQLKETIDWDAKTDYHDEKLIEIEKELATMTADSVRKEMIEKAKKDLQYHEIELKKDLKRCEDSNKWVADFLNSLQNQPTT